MTMRSFLPMSVVALLLTGCSTTAPDVKRLSPRFQQVQAPAECRLISVIPGSPAQQAGINVGDVIEKVNGKTPENGAVVADLVNKSAQDLTLDVASAEGASRTLRVVLNAQPPRLGAVCDLTGWRKAGVSPAGNESITLFEGPYATTFSGILDKQLSFIRIRLTNYSDQAVQIGPDLFTAQDGQGAPLTVLTPVQVLCTLYGDKGPHLLDRYQKKKVAMDKDTAPATEAASGDAASVGLPVVGRMANASAEFVEENAKYIAEESLWPKRLDPGATADGLIYTNEPPALPLRLSAKVGEKRFDVALDLPKASVTAMKSGDLSLTFEKMKKGSPLRLTLKSDTVFVGKFSSYDALEEKAWFDAPKGFFTTRSFPLRSIKAVEVIDK